jgi:hypothetical protein
MCIIKVNNPHIDIAFDLYDTFIFLYILYIIF